MEPLGYPTLAGLRDSDLVSIERVGQGFFDLGTLPYLLAEVKKSKKTLASGLCGVWSVDCGLWRREDVPGRVQTPGYRCSVHSTLSKSRLSRRHWQVEILLIHNAERELIWSTTGQRGTVAVVSLSHQLTYLSRWPSGCLAFGFWRPW